MVVYPLPAVSGRLKTEFGLERERARVVTAGCSDCGSEKAEKEILAGPCGHKGAVSVQRSDDPRGPPELTD